VPERRSAIVTLQSHIAVPRLALRCTSRVQFRHGVAEGGCALLAACGTQQASDQLAMVAHRIWNVVGKGSCEGALRWPAAANPLTTWLAGRAAFKPGDTASRSALAISPSVRINVADLNPACSRGRRGTLGHVRLFLKDRCDMTEGGSKCTASASLFQRNCSKKSK
jgi:hypothetical protein